MTWNSHKIKQSFQISLLAFIKAKITAVILFHIYHGKNWSTLFLKYVYMLYITYVYAAFSYAWHGGPVY